MLYAQIEATDAEISPVKVCTKIKVRGRKVNRGDLFPDLDLARFPRFAAVTVAAGLGEEEAGRGELAGVEERPGRRPAGSGRSGGPRRRAAAAAGVEDEAGDGRSWRGGTVAPERRRGGSGHRARGRGRRRRALAAETSARRRPAVAESGAGRGPPGPAAR